MFAFLKNAVSALTDNTAYSEVYAEHLRELLDVVDKKAIGENYERAMEMRDVGSALTILAKYYRKKQKNTVSNISASGRFDKELADKAAEGYAREVNISWHFEGGDMDFLFNPTLENGPVNHEWLWQFNRHFYWMNMARTYAETKDEHYAKAFKKQLLKWIGQTYIPEVHNAPCSAWRTIECGLRLLGSWQVTFDGFKSSESVDDLTLLLMIASMHRQSVHLYNNVTKANWLLMEMNGVYTFSSLFPELTDSETHRKFAVDKLITEICSQILPDGFHYELSPDYHSVALSCASNLILLARALGRADDIPERFLDITRMAVDAPIAMATPAFTQPRTNDCFTLHTASFAGRGIDLFGNVPEYKFVTTNRAEGHCPNGFTSKIFPDSGFVVMRSDWSADATYMCFDVGALGKGHMHQDKLNINIYKGDEELIFDDGGGQYEQSEARWYALSGYDHNTVLVDGLAQKRTMPEMLDKPVDANFITTADFDYAMGEYTDTYGKSFEALSKPATHKREVAFFKPDFFLINDTLVSVDGNAHDYEILFHLDTTRYDKCNEYKNAVIARFGRKYDALIIPLDGEGDISLSCVSGRVEPSYRGWYNGRNEASLHKALTVSREIKGVREFKFSTLIFPLGIGDKLPVVTRDGSNITVSFKEKTKSFNLEALKEYE